MSEPMNTHPDTRSLYLLRCVLADYYRSGTVRTATAGKVASHLDKVDGRAADELDVFRKPAAGGA